MNPERINDMRKTALKAATIFSVISPALLLGACVNFGSKPPPSLLVLSSTAKIADGTKNSGRQKSALLVLTPAAPRKLDTNRLPIQIDANRIAYLKNATWSDKPAQLMQSLLMETIAAKNGRLVLTEADAGGLAEEMLSGSLIEFGIDSRTNEAIVVYDAVTMVRGQILRKQRFEARRVVAAIEPAPASAALNDAANEVAGEIADWLKG
jgi:cholesterol transport system auxiliary component